MKVTPIRDPGPPVEAVLGSVLGQADEFRSIAVVAVDKQGKMFRWASGRLEDICAAALGLDAMAKEKIFGKVKNENDPGPTSRA